MQCTLPCCGQAFLFATFLLRASGPAVRGYPMGLHSPLRLRDLTCPLLEAIEQVIMKALIRRGKQVFSADPNANLFTMPCRRWSFFCFFTYTASPKGASWLSRSWWNSQSHTSMSSNTSLSNMRSTYGSSNIWRTCAVVKRTNTGFGAVRALRRGFSQVPSSLRPRAGVPRIAAGGAGSRREAWLLKAGRSRQAAQEQVHQEGLSVWLSVGKALRRHDE